MAKEDIDLKKQLTVKKVNTINSANNVSVKKGKTKIKKATNVNTINIKDGKQNFKKVDNIVVSDTVIHHYSEKKRSVKTKNYQIILGVLFTVIGILPIIFCSYEGKEYEEFVMNIISGTAISSGIGLILIFFGITN